MESTYESLPKIPAETSSPRSACMISGAALVPFMDFGPMPIANGFLTHDDLAMEPFFPLEVGFCEESQMVQLTQLIPPTAMFHDAYAFFSSTSARMARHFEEAAGWIQREYVSGDQPLVGELGSNDGIFLQHFAQVGVPHIGIEPSANVAEVARSKGIRTVSKFFGRECGQELRDTYGQADVVFAANVMCHIPDLNSVAEGIATWLKPSGVLIFEDPYLGDVLAKTSFDQIYDEHAFYFSGTSVQSWVQRHGLELIDMLPQSTHGGSMRYVIARKGERTVSPSIKQILGQEAQQGLGKIETYFEFASRVAKTRDQLLDALERLKMAGKVVAGYGATSKSTTVTNYCGITAHHLAYISDTTPIKQGKLSPGAHIPIVPYAHFEQKPPDVALLFAWNHGEEILAKESRYREHGGSWLTYVPEVRFL